ncbi:hypothetical protein Golob_000131 [Gossypium lobatum]|uniref:Uncharacterized protein n=1 Tax=Gossypium lobatum TaxID=34289 RepID=A0A7J8N7F8_9ROSI|nr:hypothetical protein [Gossypium lobatum]
MEMIAEGGAANSQLMELRSIHRMLRRD